MAQMIGGGGCGIFLLPCDWPHNSVKSGTIVSILGRMGEPGHGEVTELLLAWSGGEASALDKLIPLVYAELRRLAHRYMWHERAGHTLQTSELINEAYLRLVDASRVNWQDRAHFLAVAAQAMRRVLVEYARARGSQRRGAGVQRLPLGSGVECARAAKPGPGKTRRGAHLLGRGAPAPGASDRAAFLRGPQRGRNGRGAGGLRGYGVARLETGPDLAAPRDEQRKRRMPDSERERRLEELHSAALKRDASERDEFLRQACGGDAELRRAVESLLGYEQKLDGFLEVPALQTATLDTRSLGSGPRWAKRWGRIVCSSPSARAAWAKCGWPSRSSRCAGAWPSS